ncbi:hypothetical protein ACFLRX_08535 [Acidobacteriota bacterium]
MKRLTQVGKVSILTFCVLIFLLNFHQGLRADDPDCTLERALHCFGEAVEDCNDLCSATECDYTEWISGWCDDGVCHQWFEIWCLSGYLGDYEFECAGYGCGWK